MLIIIYSRTLPASLLVIFRPLQNATHFQFFLESVSFKFSIFPLNTFILKLPLTLIQFWPLSHGLVSIKAFIEGPHLKRKVILKIDPRSQKASIKAKKDKAHLQFLNSQPFQQLCIAKRKQKTQNQETRVYRVSQ